MKHIPRILKVSLKNKGKSGRSRVTLDVRREFGRLKGTRKNEGDVRRSKETRKNKVTEKSKGTLHVRSRHWKIEGDSGR